ncbi:MAG: tRNA lysidine(34) synthetase TilS [Acidobacteriota bacterium]
MPSSLLIEGLSNWFGPKVSPGDRLVVAFSGGPDSTALLWGLAEIAGDSQLQVCAAHFDHGLDADSRRRAREAGRLAAQINVPLIVGRAPQRSSNDRSESREAYARRHRYAFLERVADLLEARFIVTAHHADDQAETVILRLLFGSGLEGLAAIQELRGRLARPLLCLRRPSLLAGLESSGLEPTCDPTNRDLSTPRNAVRAQLLPFLERQDPIVAARLCRLAEAANRANRGIERCLRQRLGLRRITGIDGEVGVTFSRDAFEALPSPLVPPALALVHREAGAPYPASAAARAELQRQLAAGSGLGCDCGDGWRWEGDSQALRLTRDASSARDFAYTVGVPGSIDIPELDLTVHLTRGPLASWMFRGNTQRTGLADFGKRQVTVRNRRAGDRIRPLGYTRSRKLKDLLIDRRVPQRERDRLPLLVIDDEIAWVPGVTISDSFRIADDSPVVIAELERHDRTDSNRQAKSLDVD